MNIDKVEMNAGESFDIIKNKAQIDKQLGPSGGKSGEFFFFTHDYKWILKSVTSEELLVLRKMLPEYMYHLQSNRNSFINKIFGVFSMDLGQMQLTLKKDSRIIHLVLMRNLSQIPGKYIKRTYDLKGSEYSREVLKDNKNVGLLIQHYFQQNDLEKITMKDKDFESVEGQIRIDESYIPQVKLTLNKDVLFFRKLHLMDYSLLVMKVSWGEYLRNNPEKNEAIVLNYKNYLLLKITASSLNSFSVIPVQPQTEERVHYHFSIIDYFQKWNIQKLTEKTTKQIIKMDMNLDTSAQNPDVYADRFMEHVISKIFRGNDTSGVNY